MSLQIVRGRGSKIESRGCDLLRADNTVQLSAIDVRRAVPGKMTVDLNETKQSGMLVGISANNSLRFLVNTFVVVRFLLIVVTGHEVSFVLLQ